MLVEFTLAIGSNLLTDLVKHSGERFFDSTQLGAKLKEKLGLLDKTTEEELKKLLLETYVVYFSRYPNRQFQVFYDFFSSEDVSKCLFDYVFNFQPIDYYKLNNVLKSRMGSDWILFRILEQDSLTTKRVIEDFIECYFEAEKKSTGIGFLLTLREIRQSEQRVIEETSIKLKETSDRIIDSVVGDFTARLANLEDELKRIGVNTKDIPSLQLLDKEARRVTAAIHELQGPLVALTATSENLLTSIKGIRGISSEIRDEVDDISHLARLLHYTTLNTMGYIKVAGYRFESTNIDAIIRDLVEVYKPWMRNKGIKIEVKLHPKRQVLELSWLIELAINNLINNAVKFSYYSSKKSVPILILGERVGSLYKLSIRNFGAGIPWEEQQKIFDDGYSSSATNHLYRVGLGRGLFVAKAIIERHHGKINVSSEEYTNGFITVFEILLPYKQPVQYEEK